MKSSTKPVFGRTRLFVTIAGWYWLLTATAFAAVGIYKGINLILLMAYFLVVLFVLNWWMVRRTLHHVNTRIESINDGFAGESRRCLCHMSLVGRKRLRGIQVVLIVVRQRCKWYIPHLNRGADIPLARMIVLPARGVFSNGQIILRNSFPFGLVESTRQIQDDRPLAIYPRRGEIDLTRMLRRLGHDAAPRGIHRTAVRQLTEGTDIHGLRPFRPGDSPRWIHWRTTARVGELMVREFDRASGPNLTAIVVPPIDEIEFEQSLEFAAALVWEWSRRQDGRLRLWIAPGQHWETWELDHRRRAQDLLRRLAAAQFTTGRLLNMPNELPSRGPIVYISSKPSGASDRAGTALAEWIDPTRTSESYRPPTTKS